MAKGIPTRLRENGKRWVYYGVRLSARFIAVFVFHLRCIDRHHTRVDGGAMILSTHQSHFDPVLVGVAFNERLNFLARRSLFKNRLLGGLIGLLDAIELDRDRGGLAGLKETMKRLKQGKKVLIFPEGTRTSDGKIAPLKPGFVAIARRSRVPMIPVAIAGAYEALPRGSSIPTRRSLSIAIGPVISLEEIASLSDDDLLVIVAARLEECFAKARQNMEP